MIEQEILEIIASDSDDVGRRLNDVADQFRSGRDPKDLLALLDSDNDELVSWGAWFLKEIPFAIYESDAFLTRLRALTDHRVPLVRILALQALFPSLSAEDGTTQALIRKLLSDPDDAVRSLAGISAARLSLVSKDGPYQ
ncbi:MAG: hypothetical protein QM765_37985 [Myxococcales bacterium]